MRDRDRRRVLATARSHRATPEELSDAPKRVKEIMQELRDIELSPEARNGESRERRYSRLLRLRTLREDFISERPLEPHHANGILLSLVMAVGSLIICVSCAGVAFLGVQLLTFKPSASDTANQFWSAMQTQSYSQIYSTYLSPTQRVTFTQQQFVDQATAADTGFGLVGNVTLVKQNSLTQDQASYSYQVTRGSHKYTVTLVLILHAGTWGVDDLGAAIDPTLAGLPAPPTPTPSASPATTPTQ